MDLTEKRGRRGTGRFNHEQTEERLTRRKTDIKKKGEAIAL